MSDKQKKIEKEAIDKKLKELKNEIVKAEFTDNKADASKKLKIFFTLFLILYFTIYINLFRPILIIMNLIFSVTLTYDHVNSSVKSNAYSLFLLIGLILILVLPLIPFVRHLRKVLNLSHNSLNKISYFIFLLIECIFEIPLTFLYNSNRHSLFLIDQTGVEKVLNPWLIFFPTDYITSFICILKNLLVSGYFIFISMYIKILNNTSSLLDFSTIFKISVLGFNIINLIGVVLILIFSFIFKKKKVSEINY